jgi:DNA-binding transcriptional ArsR family regulator
MSTTPDARSNAFHEKNAIIARVVGDRDFDPGQRIVLANLVSMMDAQGRVEVSTSDLGRAAGLAKRTILRIMPSLEEAGLVTVRRQSTRQNGYRLNFV